jgi:antitoxin (DNA-binding transcriptional repressor) of toxin-antitoxin stability system
MSISSAKQCGWTTTRVVTVAGGLPVFLLQSITGRVPHRTRSLPPGGDAHSRRRVSRVPHISLLRCGLTGKALPPFDPPFSLHYLQAIQVSLQYAAEHLADLASAALRGEDVEIAQPDQPSVKLVVSGLQPNPAKTGRRILGAGRGEMTLPSEEEWSAMDKEIEQLFTNSRLFPDETE